MTRILEIVVAVLCFEWHSSLALIGTGVQDTFFIDLPEATVRQFDVALGLNSSVVYIPSSLEELEVLGNDWIYASFDTCQEAAQAEHQSSPSVPLKFHEVCESLGITHVHRTEKPARPDCTFPVVVQNKETNTSVTVPGEQCIPDLISGAVVAGDYDNDGFIDLFFTVHSGPSRLYRNKGDGTFEDVSVKTRIGPQAFGSGAVWADVDDDGDLDLYVTTLGDTRHYLYINHYNGLYFTEEAERRGMALSQANGRVLSGMTPNAGDYDRDGFVDIYVTEWIFSYVATPAVSVLLRNKGLLQAGFFEDSTRHAGLQSVVSPGNARGTFTFCSSFTDMDNDGWQDIVITADYGTSKIFWNNQNGTFTECTRDCGVTASPDAMGHAIGDWNMDGYMDWWMTAINDNSDFDCKTAAGCKFSKLGNIFYANMGGRRMFDVTSHVGVREGFWGWGNAMVDFNNDRWLDFIMTNGFDEASTTVDDRFRDQPMRLWENLGPENHGQTVEVANLYNIASVRSGRGLIKVDYDNDGDEDIVVANNVGTPSVFRNDGGNRNNWIKVKVMRRCFDMVRECQALGSRVQVISADGVKQTQEVGSGSHFMAQNDLTTHFGLGNSSTDITIVVKFPSQFSDITITNVSVNRLIKVFAPLSFFSSSSVPFSSLGQCRKAVITNVTQPSIGSVSVNPDKKSLRYSVDPNDLLLAMDDPNNDRTIRYTYQVDNLNASRRLASQPPLQASVVMYYQRSADSVQRTCAADGNDEPSVPQADPNVRTFNGRYNNVQNALWGSSPRVLNRDVPSAYGDGIETPSGQCPHARMQGTQQQQQQQQEARCPFSDGLLGVDSRRPSPRLISNSVFAQDRTEYSDLGINDLHTQFGQFLAHDLDFTSPLPSSDPQSDSAALWLPIAVPKGDLMFDRYDEGRQFLPFTRSTYTLQCTGRQKSRAREQVNKITSIMDANQVYGSSRERNDLLRSHVGGEMLVQTTPHGDMLPFNNFSLANDNPTGRRADRLLVAGDTRCNVQPGLMALHTLFIREHNRLCRVYRTANPNATDEEIFQHARRFVIAELQAITYREYVPAIVGASVTPYAGYDPLIKPEIGNVFATASFRFGHSQVNTHMWRLTEDGWVAKGGHLLLREAYFAPERLLRDGGLEPLLRGSLFQRAQKVDVKMVDEMRNMLFPRDQRNRQPGLDLAAMNIQRGRDHGLPDYNTVREHLGLPRLTSFEEITHDQHVVAALRSVYPTVDDIDVWVGGLAEGKSRRHSAVGPTFERNLLENFLRIRDGDRFWYEKIMTAKEIAEVEKLTLLEVIRRNTDVRAPRARYSFYSPSHCRTVRDHRCRQVMFQSDGDGDGGVSTPVPQDAGGQTSAASSSSPPQSALSTACQEDAVTKRILKRAIRKHKTVLIGEVSNILFNGSSSIDVSFRLQATYSLEPQSLHRANSTVAAAWPSHKCHCIPVESRSYVLIADRHNVQKLYPVTSDYLSDLMPGFYAWMQRVMQKATHELSP